MPLPNLESIIPVFDVTIPSTNDTLKFRPFLVKEEKLLLIALDGNDEKQMLDAIVQVVEACAISPITVDALSNFDLEYIFLQLRAKSVSEIVELAYRCHNQVPVSEEEYQKKHRGAVASDSGERLDSCDHVVKVSLNLDTVKVQTSPQHNKTIMLTDTMGMNMRYPNFAMAKRMMNTKRTLPKKGQEETANISDALTSIALCVESVFDADSLYSNFELKEIIEWIEKLTQSQFGKIQSFYETMPKLAHDIDFACPKCGYKEVIHLEGLPNFFG